MSRRPRADVVPIVLAALLATSCGAALRPLPSGPGAPAPDGLLAFDEAVTACRRVTSISAELSVSGSAAGQRLRGRVLAGLAAPASAILDAAAPFGASLFIYAAHDGQATVLLPRDRRVLERGDPADVLEAVTGVPLDALTLRRTLTGCPPDDTRSAARSYGTQWRAVGLTDGDAFVRRQGTEPWRLVTVVHRGEAGRGWRADYSDFIGDLPRTVRLTSADDARRFDLRLALSQVEINPALGPDVFRLTVPSSMAPITIDELRRSGPMADTAP